MQFTITLYDLALLIIFLVGTTAGIFIIISMRNFNRAVVEFTNLLRNSSESIVKAIQNLHRISDDVKVISQDAKDSTKQVSKAVEQISARTTETVMTLNRTADYVNTYAVIIAEVIKGVVHLFSHDNEER